MTVNKSKAEVLLREVENLLYLHDYDTAELLLHRAIKIDHKNPEAHYFLGDVYCKQGKFQDSITSLQTADKLLPGNARIYHLLGWAEFMAGNIGVGRKYMEKSLKILPQEVSTLCDLAVLENSQENEEEAKKYVTTALELEPHNPMAQEVFQVVNMISKMRELAYKKSN